jgi:microcystin-dependent protein
MGKMWIKFDRRSISVILLVVVVVVASHQWSWSTSLLTGEIKLFSHNTSPLPHSWVFCHGQALSRIKYQRLFSAIGVSFGGGDGQTTFNVPDFRGRFPLGLNPAQNQVAGKNTGGSSTQTLTVDQMPAHKHDQGTLVTASAGDHVHSVNDPGHNHGGSTDSRPGGAGGWNLKNNGGGRFEDQTSHAHTIPIGRAGISILNGGTHSHSISGLTGSAGNGKSFSIMPPYQTVDFIIYTGD